MQHSASDDTDLVADFISSLDAPFSVPAENEIRDPSSVHFWLIDQTTEEFLAAAERVSPSPEDEARAARLMNADARRLFMAQRAALRLVLGHHLVRAADEVGLIIRLPGGKPALAPRPGDPPLGFSVAHSGGWLAIAVAAGPSLGVDIEAPRALGHAGAIAARWFLPAERVALEALGPAAADGFLALWTAKEALAKRHGAGLRLLRPGAEALAIAPEWRAGRLKPFRAPSGAIGALASSAPLSHVHHSRSLTDLLANR